MVNYDIVVVGAGIAGLHTAIEAKKLNKKLKILVLEKYPNPGGRMVTIHTTVANKKLQYECGAGRINAGDHRLHKLIKHYNLNTHNLGDTTLWRKYGTSVSIPNNFTEFWYEMCKQFALLPIEDRRNKTLRDLAIETMGVEVAKSLLETYPYRAEIEVASAESAIDLYLYLSQKPHFSVLKEGFSELIKLMVKDAKKLGVEFKTEIVVNRIDISPKTHEYTVTAVKNKECKMFQANHVVLAVPKNALQQIYPFSPDNKFIKAVKMEPLLRIYSVYKDPSWFPPANVVTNSPLRYIIPVNKEQGLIMSSYLDSRDIQLWTDLYEKGHNEELIEKIHNETTALFPELNIKEKPIYTSPEIWRDGCSYWLTGTDYKKLSKDALQPLPDTYPNLHLVGESFCLKQQWIEGALEHAEELIKLLKPTLLSQSK
jgi:protoporphyrinogen oxidase